jgi:hypothetical protein
MQLETINFFESLSLTEAASVPQAWPLIQTLLKGVPFGGFSYHHLLPLNPMLCQTMNATV